MSDPWVGIPRGHRRRDYEYPPSGVIVVCQCRWRSTLARTVEDARMLWAIHIRNVIRGPRR